MFINRDPIEETGGLNLYGFCGNDPINRFDVNGYSWLSKLWDHTILKIGQQAAINWDHSGRQVAEDVGALVVGLLTAGIGLEVYAAIEGGVLAGGFLGAVGDVGLVAGWGGGWSAAAGAGFGFGSGFAGALEHGSSVGSALVSGLKGGLIGGLTGAISGLLPGGGAFRPVEDVQTGWEDSGIGGASRAAFQDIYSQAATYGARDVMGSIAHHEGISLTELDVGLTALSFAGDYLMGDRGPLTDDGGISGYRSRIISEDKLFGWNPALHADVGMIFDTFDALLTYQGLPSATGWKAIFSGAISNINLGHSLGASEVNVLASDGIVGPSSVAALPLGRVAPFDVNVVNGSGDIVPGGWFSKIFNPWATIISPWEFGAHTYAKYYQSYMPVQ